MIDEFIDLIPYNLRIKARTNYDFLIKDLKYQYSKKYKEVNNSDFEIYQFCAVLNVIYNSVIRDADSLINFFKIKSLNNSVSRISIGSSKFDIEQANELAMLKKKYLTIINKYRISADILEITDSYGLFKEIEKFINEENLDE
ncbi:MAG: hypothetical protein BGO41_15375 [Clostridiales bacterium 38-18]|nr:MAG: hypothetical protein BGO41_15375 [Clostridiales bacterium 38-18]